MFICWKKFCYAALTAKTFAKFAPFLDPKMEVEKWTQKWCQNLTPQNGVQNGTQKGGPIFFWFKKDLQEIKALFEILGLPFGCHFWTPFWGSNSGTIFGSIFQPPFWGQRWCKICKSFCCQSCIAKLFQQANMHIKMHL